MLLCFIFRQAALGPIALALAINKGLIEFVPVAHQILTIAVISILITAPLGAIGIMVAGPKLLTRDRSSADENENDSVEKDEIP